MCPYYKVTEKISVPAKKVVHVIEMNYPKMTNANLLELFRPSDSKIFSRNFYWLHLPGSDYKRLEAYRQRRVPLKITSNVIVTGATYKIDMHIQNMLRESKKLIHGIETPRNEGGGILKRIFRGSCSDSNVKRVVETSGTDLGVAFFLHMSVHASEKIKKKTTGEDTIILSFRYSYSYFSIVPGEKMTVSMSFEVPQGITPRVSLDGWNCHEKQCLLNFLQGH